MYQLDDNFLVSVGLGGMPVEEKQAFLEYLREQLELRVGEKLSEGLTERQAAEFDAFIKRDREMVEDWYVNNLPDYAQRPEYQQFKQSAPDGVDELDVMCEYGALQWLMINRPQYREVVQQETELLRQEVIKSRDSILS